MGSVGHRKIGKFWSFPGPRRGVSQNAVNNSVPLARYVDFPPADGRAERRGILSRPQAELRMRHTAASDMKPTTLRINYQYY